MALLQIAEPGQSTVPHQRRLMVGIDLGTTNSLVATVRNGSAAVLPDARGRPLLPSIVRYLADGRVDVASLLTDRYPLSQATDAIEHARQRRGIKTALQPFVTVV